MFNCFAVGVQRSGFSKDKRTTLAFHMKTDGTGFDFRIVFVKCVIYYRMDRRALGDRDKVTLTNSLLAPPEMKVACLSADSL